MKTHQKNYGPSQLTKRFAYLQYTACQWSLSGIMLYQVCVVKVRTNSHLTYLHLLLPEPFAVVTSSS